MEKTREVKRLVWFLNYDLLYSGGGERLLFEGLRYFSSNGIEACLYTNGNAISTSALFNGTYKPKILVKKIPFKKGNKFSLRHHLIYIKESVKPILEFDPDVIISNDINSLTLLWKANKLGYLSVPVLCFNHGSLFQFENDISKYSLIFKRNFKKIWENDLVYRENISPTSPALSFKLWIINEVLTLISYLSVRYAKAIFVLTRKNKKEVEILYKHNKVYNIHGAFSKDLFNQKLVHDKKSILGCSNKTVILSLSRLEKKKQIDVIIKAFSIYYKKNENAVLWIGGTGSYEYELKELVKKLGLEKTVIFLGFVKDEELNDYYLSADLFVTADNADYDITTFVALALGVKAVVSAQHEFEPELTSNNLVHLANPIPIDFANSFEFVLQSESHIDKEKRDSLLESYTWEYYFDKVIQITKSIA